MIKISACLGITCPGLSMAPLSATRQHGTMCSDHLQTRMACRRPGKVPRSRRGFGKVLTLIGRRATKYVGGPGKVLTT